MNNADLVRGIYESFAVGDVQAVVAAFDPEIEWRHCPSFPFVPSAEALIGTDAVMQHIFTQLPLYYDNFRVNVETVFSSGEDVTMVGYYSGVWKSTGKEFKAHVAHIWKAKDGKLTRFFQAADTATIMNP